MVKQNNRNDMLDSPMSNDYLTYENQGYKINVKSIDICSVTDSFSSPPTVSRNEHLNPHSKYRKHLFYTIPVLIVGCVLGLLALVFLVLQDTSVSNKTLQKKIIVDETDPKYQNLLQVLNLDKLPPVPLANNSKTKPKTVADIFTYTLDDLDTQKINEEIYFYTQFYYFVVKYKKLYTDFQDLVKHFMSFKENSKLIDEHKQDSTYTVQMNKFGDMNFDEYHSAINVNEDKFIQTYKYYDQPHKFAELMKYLKTVPLPKFNSSNINLQQLRNEITREIYSPNKDQLKFTKGMLVDLRNLLGAICKGPVVVSIKTSPDFQFYKDGVYQCPISSKSNQVLLLVGIGYDSATETYYWNAVNALSDDIEHEDCIKVEMYNGTSGCKFIDTEF